MEIENLLAAFVFVSGELFTLKGMLLLLGGITLGLVMGAIPGLGAVTAISLLMPFTYGWLPLDAFLVFTAVFGASTVGGSVSSILINVPGTPENLMTTVDGYPLTRQGRAIESLATSGFSSLAGSAIGLLLFVPLIPFLSKASLIFGPPEVFWLVIFTLFLLAVVSGGSFIANLLIGGFSFIIAAHGLSILSGVPRFAHGVTYLWGGIPIVPAILGTFAIGEVIKLFGQKKGVVTGEVQIAGSRRKGLENVLKNPLLVLRSSILGFIIGVIPAVGGTVANYLAYGQAVQTCKDPENFGKGDVRGIIAPESANNCKDVGQLVPTLTLGIPGSGTMVVFLGALLLHGISPGPFLMRDNLEIVAMVTLVMVFAFSISCLFVIFGGRYFPKIIQLDIFLVGTVVVVISFIASYFLRYQVFDLVVVVVFGVLAYVTVKIKGSTILLIMPLIIGPIAEQNLILSLQISRGNYSNFFSPISIIILILTALGILSPFIRQAVKRNRRK